MAFIVETVDDNPQADDCSAYNDVAQDDGHPICPLASPRPPSILLRSPVVTDSVGPNHTPKSLPISHHSCYASPSLSPAARSGPPAHYPSPTITHFRLRSHLMATFIIMI